MIATVLHWLWVALGAVAVYCAGVAVLVIVFRGVAVSNGRR